MLETIGKTLIWPDHLLGGFEVGHGCYKDVGRKYALFHDRTAPCFWDESGKLSWLV